MADTRSAALRLMLEDMTSGGLTFEELEANPGKLFDEYDSFARQYEQGARHVDAEPRQLSDDLGLMKYPAQFGAAGLGAMGLDTLAAGVVGDWDSRAEVANIVNEGLARERADSFGSALVQGAGGLAGLMTGLTGIGALGKGASALGGASKLGSVGRAFASKGVGGGALRFGTLEAGAPLLNAATGGAGPAGPGTIDPETGEVIPPSVGEHLLQTGKNFAYGAALDPLLRTAGAAAGSVLGRVPGRGAVADRLRGAAASGAVGATYGAVEAARHGEPIGREALINGLLFGGVGLAHRVPWATEGRGLPDLPPGTREISGEVPPIDAQALQSRAGILGGPERPLSGLVARERDVATEMRDRPFREMMEAERYLEDVAGEPITAVRAQRLIDNTGEIDWSLPGEIETRNAESTFRESSANGGSGETGFPREILNASSFGLAERIVRARDRESFRQEQDQDAYWGITEGDVQGDYLGLPPENPVAPMSQPSRMSAAAGKAQTRAERKQEAAAVKRRALVEEAQDHGDPLFAAVVDGTKTIYVRPQESHLTGTEADFRRPTPRERAKYGIQTLEIEGVGEFWWDPKTLHDTASALFPEYVGKEKGKLTSVRSPAELNRLLKRLSPDEMGQLLYGREAALREGVQAVTARDASGKEITTIATEDPTATAETLTKQGAAAVETSDPREILTARLAERRARIEEDMVEGREIPRAEPVERQPASPHATTEGTPGLSPGATKQYGRGPFLSGLIEKLRKKSGMNMVEFMESIPPEGREAIRKLEEALVHHDVLSADKLPEGQGVRWGKEPLDAHFDTLIGTLTKTRKMERWNDRVVPLAKDLGLPVPRAEQHSRGLPSGKRNDLQRHAEALILDPATPPAARERAGRMLGHLDKLNALDSDARGLRQDVSSALGRGMQTAVGAGLRPGGPIKGYAASALRMIRRETGIDNRKAIESYTPQQIKDGHKRTIELMEKASKKLARTPEGSARQDAILDNLAEHWRKLDAVINGEPRRFDCL